MVAMGTVDEEGTVAAVSNLWSHGGFFPTGFTGFLGGFSTFSTAINEMVTLFRKHRYPTAAAYLVLSLGVPVVAAACGFLV